MMTFYAFVLFVVLSFDLVASLPKPETKSGQLCLKSPFQPHMESSFEQEPVEKQHQTTCSSVSEDISSASLFELLIQKKIF